jgi:hypothetical protein
MRFLKILIPLLLSLHVNSQDKIYKLGGDIMLVLIQEIGVDEVKYKLFEKQGEHTYAIQKDLIVKIIFQNGRTEIYKSSLKDPALYKGQTRNAIKINLLSPLFGYTQFGFERSLKPGRSMEFNVGIIGWGKNQAIGNRIRQYYNINRDAKGANIGIGYKFIKPPDFINYNIRFAHLLQGSYLKPTLYAGIYEENIVNHKPQIALAEERTTVYASLICELGKQWIFGEHFMIDIYFGLGFCIDNIKHEDYTYSNFSSENQAFHFNTFRFGSSIGGALNGGLKIGMLLGKNNKY